MLSNKTSFEEQISDWLKLIGFTCKICKKEEEIFTTLEIQKTGNAYLHLKLIELQLWGSEKSIEELKLFAAAQDKLRLCGINSIILWEDQWKGKSDIVKSRLMALLGISIRIPARLTYSVRINKEIAGQFLGKNHLQGTVQSKYQFGLYLPVKYFRILPTGFQVTNVNEDLLVAVATFSHVRIFIKQEKPFRSFELIRFSNLINTTVVGGMDKLLSAFTKEIHPDDIMTYIDKEWSDGISYAKLGFERISEKPPITFWLDTEKYVRFSDRKHTTGKNTIQICNVGSLKFVKTIIKKPSGF